MTYLVLARKWRPRSFETLIGQDHVVRALTHALSTQRLHHAWLFTGTRGVGKTTLSRILAKSLNCESGITATPCGVCRACTEIDEGRFVDYLELDAASNRGVDEMTQLLEQAVYAPSVGRFKVYMIDEVHMLTGHAFNAMLKTLEEPPAHVKFILATTDPQKIPVTILSRCLQFNLKQMTAQSMVAHLQSVLEQEKIDFETPALRLIAQAASGSMRDALSLTDQAIAYSAENLTTDAVRGMLGTLDQRHLVRLLQALSAGSGTEVLGIADELAARGLSYSGALSDLAVLLSRVAIEQRIPGAVPGDDPLADEIADLGRTLHPDLVQLFYSVAVHSRNELSLAPDEYAGFVMACLRMLSLAPPDPAGGDDPPKKRTEPENDPAPTPPAGSGHSPDSAGRLPAGERIPAVPAAAQSAAPALRVPAAPVANTAEATVPDAASIPGTASPSNPGKTFKSAQAPRPALMAEATAKAAGAASAAASPARAAPVSRPAPVPSGALRDIPAWEDEPAATETGPGAAVAEARPDALPARAAEKTASVQKNANAGAPAPAPENAVPPASAYEDHRPSDIREDEFFSDGQSGEPLSDAGHFVPDDPDDAEFETLSSRIDETAVPAFAADRKKAKKVPRLGAMTPQAWPALAASLPLTGLAAELARQSEWVGSQGEQINLRVAIRTLAESPGKSRLRTLLSEHFGAVVQLNVEYGATGDETAHAVAQAQKEALQKQAELAVQADPFIRTLISEFGAAVIPGSIRAVPLDKAA
jgi:DNA polymerase-3 subunit gamma/tau